MPSPLVDRPALVVMTMAPFAARRPVECRGCGAFEHRDVVDVLGIEVCGPVAVVDPRVGVVVRRPAHGRHAARHGHAVDHEQRRVVVHVDGRFAAQRDAQRSAGTGRGVVEVKACHLARKGVEPVVRNGGRQVLVVHFRHGISQRLLFAGHTQRRDHDAFDRLGFRLHRHIETGLPSPDTLRCLLVAQVGEGQLSPSLARMLYLPSAPETVPRWERP